MPQDGSVPIGDQTDKDCPATLRHEPGPGDLGGLDDPDQSIDAGIRTLAERRLKLICDALDLPAGFFEGRAQAEASPLGLRGTAAGAEDPDLADFLDGQQGAPMVDVVTRVKALKDPDLQRRLLRYLSCMDV